MSTLRPVALDTASPVSVEEMYIFHRLCPMCNPKARILDEAPESSFVKALKGGERWEVCQPVVEAAIPDAIRRFGRFDFEVEEDLAGEEKRAMVGGKNRTASGEWKKMSESRPVYVEDTGSKEKTERQKKRDRRQSILMRS